MITAFQSWPVGLQTTLLLLASNVFMTLPGTATCAAFRGPPGGWRRW